jgi:hypothetical protein
MIGLPFGPTSGQLPEIAVEGYAGRCDAGVRQLAAACGLDPERELERFRWCSARLDRQPAQPSGDVLGALTHVVGGALPIIFEYVLTYAGDGPRGFAYLSRGRPGGSLPHGLGELLAAALQIHVEDRGQEDEAVLLAEVFRLAFPDLDRLADFSPLAQGMIVGVVPDGEHVRLKIYFNTRLGSAGGHREKIAGMLARCGLDDCGLYDGLYAGVAGAAFHGLGVDLNGDGSRRAKLYVRVPREGLRPALQNVARSVAGRRELAELVEPADAMLAALAGGGVADTVELAGALREDGAPTIKVTLFYSAAHVSHADADRVVAYLDDLGYESASLRAVVAALSKGGAAAKVQPHPLHGVGLEVPASGRPKVNVYVQPVI